MLILLLLLLLNLNLNLNLNLDLNSGRGKEKRSCVGKWRSKRDRSHIFGRFFQTTVVQPRLCLRFVLTCSLLLRSPLRAEKKEEVVVAVLVSTRIAVGTFYCFVHD